MLNKITTASAKISMKVTKNFELLSVDEKIWLRLSCDACRRDSRTVVLDKNSEDSYCTWWRANEYTKHKYVWNITKISSKYFSIFFVRKVLFRINFQYLQNKDFWELTIQELNWIRVKFKYRCKNCGQIDNDSIQTNLWRPYSIFCKKCNMKLYVDYLEPKLIKIK